MKFINYDLKEYIHQGLSAINFVEATDVQNIVISRFLNGDSLVVKSSTGSGKTHSFIIPMLENLDENKKEVQFLVLSPTRELAFQLYEEVGKITKFNANVDVRLYVGGTNRDSELKRLEKSQPQIVIATPGKLSDLANDANALKIYTLNTVIIDEADMVFKTKDSTELDKIFVLLDNLKQVCAFSATIPTGLVSFINKYLLKYHNNKCELIDLSKRNINREGLEYIFLPTKNQNKLSLLVSLLRSFTPYLVLIFANTKQRVDEVSKYLGENGFKCVKISGDLESRERKQVLKRIKDGDIQYVVATDIASRGIDITGVSHVINFELPQEVEYFIHRVGRSARLNQSGVAISLYDYNDDDYINNLRKKGLNCSYYQLKDNTLVKTNKRSLTVHKSEKIRKIEEDVHMRTPMPKKVKPGYKKKRLEKINKKLRQMKHQKIDEMYFKNVHKKKDNNNEY